MASTDQSPGARPVCRVATLGEALIDLIALPDGRFEPCLGGAVFNLTRALSLQGVATLYLNPLSRDAFGTQLMARLRDDGVHLARPQPVVAPTSVAVVRSDPRGLPDYSLYREGVADREVDAASLNAACAATPGLEWVVTGCLALDPDDAATLLPWLDARRAAGQCVAVDANLRPGLPREVERYRAHVQAVLGRADLIKVSDEDLAHLGLEGDPLTLAQALLAQSPTAKALVLTQGAEGAWLLTRCGQRWHARERRAVEVVDTVGAGDCFFAGLLSALLREPLLAQALSDGEPWDDEAAQRVLRHAIASASLCVQARGCVPPDEGQIQAWLQA